MEQEKISRIEWLSALCMFVLFYVVYDSTIQVAIIIGIIIVTLIAIAVSHGGKLSIQIDGLHLYLFIFCLFCYISALWAQNSSYAVARGNKAFEILVGIFVLSLIFNKNHSIRGLLKLIQWGNYIILAYAVISYGWSTFISVLQEGTRVTNEYLNANTLGMCAAYAIVINLYFVVYEKFKITDLLMVLAFFVLIASGSRKALMILIGGIFAVFILKNYNQKNFMNSVLKIFLILVALILLLVILSRLPIFSGINTRMSSLFSTLFEGDSSEGSAWLRVQYNQLGWQLFGQHPIAGLGMDNARLYTISLYGYDHYLHDNYIEMLADGGVIGTVIYYSIYAYIIYIMFKFSKYRDGEWDICMILLITQLVMDIGMVSYSVRGTYVYLLLFWIEAQRIKRKCKNLEYNKEKFNLVQAKGNTIQ